MTRRIVVSGAAEASQRLAADPRHSAWVAANAGSGKTHVLTERVLRLLLSGISPESILCLTYTKAAAAEMRRRVSTRLAEWAVLDDASLAARLEAMEQRAPTPELMIRARTLFAHALETPGGLKINTIHAFCESVLHRFPLEAGVPFDFSVIEEADAQDMIRRAREGVLAGGLKPGSAVAEAVESLFELMSDFAIGDAIDMALAQGRKLRPVLADRVAAKRRLRALVAAVPEETRASVLAEMASGHPFTRIDYARLLSLTPPKPGGSAFEDRLARIDPQRPDPLALLEAFLTADRTVPKRFPKKLVSDAEPDLATRLSAEAERLQALVGRLTRAALVERSEALLDVLGGIVDRYEAEKRGRSLLDFDDLIRTLGDLFADPLRADWVKYKLDTGITHILVDESQDTNPEQWRVVREIAREFFVGDSAVTRPRTLFAVGDEKQSIYSFQGADPQLFAIAGREFERRAIAAQQGFKKVPLRTSFRTLPGILAAVDLVAALEPIREGLLAPLDNPVIHESARDEGGGTVTLWPPIRQLEDELETAEWSLTVTENVGSAPRQLADRIARQIARWVRDGRALGPRGRAVRPDDVLILVQSRSALFFELIRALGQQKLPTPGADRLAVTGHIGVLDLLALGDVLLNPADDLQLATLLRSPLFGVGEDELFAIARDRKATLWQALGTSPLPSAHDAFGRLNRWRGRLDFDRPYEFYAEILYAEGGLRRLHARLGGEIFDVVSEFLELALAHEQTAQPSLQGFLAEMRAREVSIKRELAEAVGGVRVMTVHGAKGLESPIVILADAASQPQGRQTNKSVFVVPATPGPLFVHASGRKDHVPETLRLREIDEAAQQAEYWRKLYVGMTRAEDELYVTGVLTKTGKLEGTWYEAIETALAPHSAATPDPDGGPDILTYPRLRPVVPPARVVLASTAPETRSSSLPPLPAPILVPVISPSSAAEQTNAHRRYQTAAEAATDADQARREGTALHALLQHLGRLPRQNWQQAVDKTLPVLLPGAPDRHIALGERAISILGNPAFAELFGPLSRAEVPFLAEARRNGQPVRLAGRIDRILIAKQRVLVVDYKSDANPPRIAEEVPAPYMTQVGLYALVAGQLFPGLVVEAAILWTTLESLMILPTATLRNAVSAFTMR
jgi:ATP-dependent helicase/nuclease subunit A